jgi:prepilin-type N-terminal cleavage/methylation domain-containing protein
MKRARPRRHAFTLVELIIVMGLLALAAGIAAPMLARSLRGRSISEEAQRFIALTEYGRDEAVSQGVPMTVWIDPGGQRFGVEPKEGFEGDTSRSREFALNPDIFIKADRILKGGSVSIAAEYAPDGAPATSNVDALSLEDRFGNVVNITRTRDLWSYEIVKETK